MLCPINLIPLKKKQLKGLNNCPLILILDCILSPLILILDWILCPLILILDWILCPINLIPLKEKQMNDCLEREICMEKVSAGDLVRLVTSPRNEKPTLPSTRRKNAPTVVFSTG